MVVSRPRVLSFFRRGALMRTFIFFSTGLAVGRFATAQLSGRVGPTTTREQKASVKICNIMSYGASAEATTDNSAAITMAWDACKNGGQVYIPDGSYGLGNWTTLDGGKGVSINLEGTIFRIGTTDLGNMIKVRNTSDFELYSGTSKGAVQGNGYEFHAQNLYGPRMLRLENVTDFSVHDLALVDSPAFHFNMDNCSNGEVYNVIIHGANKGGLDGIDVVGNNIWVHDVAVTNKDECVTVKSPASNILVSSVFCNWSGGCAIGSLSDNTTISNVTYSHIYSANCNQFFMIKSKGGSGFVRDSQFINFLGHSSAYALNIDSSWARQVQGKGDGVALQNLTFSNWTGTTTGGNTSDGLKRPSLRMFCPPKVPCTGIRVDNLRLWSDNNSTMDWKCQNAFGSGACTHEPRSGPVGRPSLALAPYADSLTVTEPPPDFAYETMPDGHEVKDPIPVGQPIPIPPVPKMFFPGLEPVHALLGG